MVEFSSGRCGKLQQTQISEEVKKIKNYIANSSAGMSKAEYLSMHEALQIEVSEKDIPVELDDFLYDTLVVFDIFSLLKDDWDTFNGSYLGKQLDILPMLYKMFSVGKDKQTIYLYLLNEVINENIKVMADKTKQKEIANKEIESLVNKSSGSVK